VLGDPAIQAAFKEKYMGYDLPVPPTNWDEYLDVACFITELNGGAPMAPARSAIRLHPVPLPGALPHEGGKFFDPDTMKRHHQHG
jgi:ABC-type glycerol-3-phosphate transport system substrate-binding protein